MLDLEACTLDECDTIVYQARHLLDANIATSLCVGEKTTGYRRTGRRALIVGVANKVERPSDIPPQKLVPPRLNVCFRGSWADVETDVVSMGVPTLAAFRGQQRPATVGFEVAALGGKAGTMGPILRDQLGALHLLSNAHVFTDFMRQSTIGTPIVQPGSTSRQDAVAVLERFTPLRAGEYLACDAAIAAISDMSKLSGRLADGTAILGIEPRRLDEREFVRLIGSTSGSSWGQVRDVGVDQKVLVRPDSTATYTMTGQIRTTAGMGRGGDSGGAVVDTDGYLVGLFVADHWSGDLVTPISTVLETLGNPTLCETAPNDTLQLSFDVMAA